MIIGASLPKSAEGEANHPNVERDEGQEPRETRIINNPLEVLNMLLLGLGARLKCNPVNTEKSLMPPDHYSIVVITDLDGVFVNPCGCCSKYPSSISSGKPSKEEGRTTRNCRGLLALARIIRISNLTVILTGRINPKIPLDRLPGWARKIYTEITSGFPFLHQTSVNKIINWGGEEHSVVIEGNKPAFRVHALAKRMLKIIQAVGGKEHIIVYVVGSNIFDRWAFLQVRKWLEENSNSQRKYYLYYFDTGHTLI